MARDSPSPYGNRRMLGNARDRPSPYKVKGKVLQIPIRSATAASKISSETTPIKLDTIDICERRR